jgi:TonB family protein
LAARFPLSQESHLAPDSPRCFGLLCPVHSPNLNRIRAHGDTSAKLRECLGYGKAARESIAIPSQFSQEMREDKGMKQVISGISGAMLLLAGIAAATAQSSEAAISARLKGQTLLIRGFWLDDNLKFDQAGQPTGVYKEGSFTESMLDVTGVKLVGDLLTVEGQRVALVFDSKGYASRLPLLKPKSRSPEIVTIEIDGQGNPDFSKELDTIFAANLAEIVPSLPDYWQRYARKHFLGSTDPADDIDIPKHPDGKIRNPPPPDQNFTHIAKNVKPPRLTKSVDPHFTEIARQQKFSGNTTVYLWVDENGIPSHLAVVRPIGLGLDEEAIAAVRQYKFSPAIQDGKPVKVDLYIDVNFQIF